MLAHCKPVYDTRKAVTTGIERNRKLWMHNRDDAPEPQTMVMRAIYLPKMGFGFQQQQQHSVQRSLVHELHIRSPIKMQSKRPARAPTFSNCERGRMTPVLLDHEYNRGGHSTLSICFFLTLSGEANTQIRCGRTGTSRHEDTCLLAPRTTKQNQSFSQRVERPHIG